MRVLVIGGTGFIGPHITRELIRRDQHVTVFHRGRTAVPPGALEIVGDRQRLTESVDNLRALAPDVVVDVVLSSGRQARELMKVFRGHARRVVASAASPVATGASTRIACQLASTPGVSSDSLPPAMATSIQPARIARIASPTATAEEAQAQA